MKVSHSGKQNVPPHVDTVARSRAPLSRRNCSVSAAKSRTPGQYLQMGSPNMQILTIDTTPDDIHPTSARTTGNYSHCRQGHDTTNRLFRKKMEAEKRE